MRLGVVLLVPSPLRREVDAFRRSLGDGTFGRVPAHVTLVPPVNVNQADLGDALRVLREAAAATRPFSVHLGPPTSFLPANPVLYLPLVGEGRGAVFALRERVFRPPLARALTWPFVPHVTLADEADPERVRAGQVALCDYGAEAYFERLHLLREEPGRVWRPFADAAFSAPAVVGRGSLPLEVSVTSALDPEARAFSDAEWDRHWASEGLGGDPERPNLAVTARREGRIIATAEGWARAGAAFLDSLIVAEDVRNQGVGTHVLAAYEAAALERGCPRLAADVWAGSRAEAFYRHRGWVEEGRRPAWWGERERVLLRRDR
ncbi:MAG TPA: GNAT family N-acetyltransferase [Acidimicrobiales bacterium]|jgi:2'-5' RNA ligase/GNAT superfamily N-acetyltransferase|nr:GNAT family N-acetyltransferase [Acidimicrobiales bacterium]